MHRIASNWIQDPPDTRDFDLTRCAESTNEFDDRISRVLEGISAQINKIKRHRLTDESLNELGLELVPDEESDREFPVAACVLLALESMEGLRGEQLRYSRRFLHQNCLAATGSEELDFGIRNAVKTLVKYGALTEKHCFEDEEKFCFDGPVTAGNQADFVGLKYFRLDPSPSARRKGNRKLFDKVSGCIRSGLPAIFTVMRFSDSLNWTSENNFKQLPIPDRTSYPIGLMPTVGCSIKVLKPSIFNAADIESLELFTQAKNAKQIIEGSKRGIKVRHFAGPTIGEDEPGFAIVPEWYFHLGLVRDCWVLVSPDWLDSINIDSIVS